jgi:K+-sensing histidine kinase KdpD
MVMRGALELQFARGAFVAAARQAERIEAELGDTVRSEIPGVLARQADALVALGRQAEAVPLLQRALKLAEALLCGLASIFEGQGKLRGAHNLRQRARNIVADIVESLSPIGLHGSFLQQPMVRSLVTEA